MQAPINAPSPVETGKASNSRTGGIRQQRIGGGFVHISTHQLALGWWLYHAGHITMRQFRVWLATFELLERRRHMVSDGDRKPLYRVEEIQALVGGRGSQRAAAALKSDLRALAQLGLVTVTDHTIEHATSIEHIRLADVSGFWSIYAQLPHQKRRVPIPRRTLRALAGGFSRAVTAVMLALLIRSLFWQRGRQGSEGSYRVDGRTKLAWIAEVFGISRRAVTDARSKLIELGWIAEVECNQWELNRWGVRDTIVVDWQPRDAEADSVADSTTDSAGDGACVGSENASQPDTESASPRPQNDTDSASPCLNRSLFLSEKELNNRTLGAQPPGPAGVSIETLEKKQQASRGRRWRQRGGDPTAPALQEIQPADLARDDRLLALFGQAVEQGLIADCEAGRLDFFALAERARARGRHPGALFKWLLVQRRFDYITQADEDAAADRLRKMREGPRSMMQQLPGGVGGDRDAMDGGADAAQLGGGSASAVARSAVMERTDDEEIVQSCLRVVQQLNTRGRRPIDPFDVARQKWQWSRERWDQAHGDYQFRQRERWYGGGQ